MRFIAILIVIAAAYYFTLYLMRSIRDWYRGAYGSRPAGGNSRRAPYGTQEHSDPEERYREILGITRQDGPADIKRKYRELLAKYHPDKVQHLGQEFQELAEYKTRKILEAYGYFQKKYGL